MMRTLPGGTGSFGLKKSVIPQQEKSTRLGSSAGAQMSVIPQQDKSTSLGISRARDAQCRAAECTNECTNCDS